MATVVIPESDAQTFKSLQNGESVEAQAIVTESGEKDFRKGRCGYGKFCRECNAGDNRFGSDCNQ